jgi:hypothetical protein
MQSDLLKLLIGDLVLDPDKALIVFVLILGLSSLSLSLSLAIGLSLGDRSLRLLGRSSDFLIVRGVVIRRQDDGRGALLS